MQGRGTADERGQNWQTALGPQAAKGLITPTASRSGTTDKVNFDKLHVCLQHCVCFNLLRYSY